MAKPLIQVRNISAKEVNHTDIHNGRKYKQNGLSVPDNIDINKSNRNLYFALKDNKGNTVECGSLQEAIDSRIQESGVTKRKNSVVALEYVVSASPEFFEVYSSSGHFSNCMKWLARKHGNENVISMAMHYDETNPHAHIIAVPIVEKERRWKNLNAEGHKKENRLCARDFTGNKDKLRQLQQDYYEFCCIYGSKYGITFTRGVKSEEQKKKYLKQTSHIIGSIYKALSDMEKRLESLKSELQNIDSLIAEKKIEEIKKKESELSGSVSEQKKNLDDTLQEIAEKEKRENLWKRLRNKDKPSDFNFDQ